MAGHSFIGTWEVVGYGYINGTPSENYVLEGVRFRLDETGDVTWVTTEELKSVPLFSCETYEIHSTPLYFGVVIRFGAYAGHVIEFTSEEVEPKETVLLTCDGWCMLKCKRVKDEPMEQNFNSPFSLLPALEDGYFSDVTIYSSNNKEFKIHSCIVQLLGNDIDWQLNPPPFSGLSEDVLGTILHFFYAECLPDTLDEITARHVINIASQYQSLEKLMQMCKVYLKNMALKQQIIGLVNDMHGCINQVIEHFNTKNVTSPSENITSNPAKLCFVMKQSVRDIAVAAAKLLLLCDLFTKRKTELTREERQEIIRYAKSRMPIFLTQLQKFLLALKNTFSSMSASQRNEVASYLVPEIEVILETISLLIVEIEKALQQLIQVLSPHDTGKTKSGVGDVLGKSLRTVLHIRELTKLKNFHEHITCTLVLLLHKKENFNEMSFAQKVRSVSRNLEQLIDELPFFLLRIEEITGALDDRVEWRDFKFVFKVGTSKVSGVLQKLVSHQHTLQDVMTRLCELVQRDSFTQSVHTLGLLDLGNIAPHGSEYRVGRSSYSTPKHQHGYKLNLVESLCISPVTSDSNLSKFSLQLLKGGLGTDMEFEIVVNNSAAEQTMREHAERCDQLEDERLIIRAHRVIVAARCDWFRRALSSGMKEAINRKIVIHDTTPFLFKIFLEYLYSGKLRHQSLSTEQLSEVLLLSDRYEVDTLKQACEYALQSSIDLESVLYFLSMADQFNAKYLRHACLHFVSQHHELTESEVFYELPIALQAEVFDCVWTQPLPKKSVTTEHLLAHATPTSADSGMSEVQKAISGLHFTSQTGQSISSSPEDLPLSHDSTRLDACILQLRDIVGEEAPREKLVQVVLAADYDLCRAINYFYAKASEEE